MATNSPGQPTDTTTSVAPPPMTRGVQSAKASNAAQQGRLVVADRPTQNFSQVIKSPFGVPLDPREREEAESQKPIPVMIEGLGNIQELAQEVRPEEELSEGEGDWLVVQHQSVTGIDGIYHMGRVIRASKLCPSWPKYEKNQDGSVNNDVLVSGDPVLAARQIARHFQLESVRLATAQEIALRQGYVDTNNPLVIAERTKTAMLENELESTRRELEELRRSQAGSVGVAKSNSGTTGTETGGQATAGQPGQKKEGDDFEDFS